MERCPASARVAGAFEVTVAGWFAPRKYQAPPATEVSAYPSDWVRSAGRQPLRDLKLAHLLSERLFRRVIRHPK